jgi:cytochrome P450
MEYLNAFIKESLRITSSVTGIIIRTALKNTKIGHLNIKKGDTVIFISLKFSI